MGGVKFSLLDFSVFFGPKFDVFFPKKVVFSAYLGVKMGQKRDFLADFRGSPSRNQVILGLKLAKKPTPEIRTKRSS